MSAQHSPEHPPRSDQPTRRDLLIVGAAAGVAPVAAAVEGVGAVNRAGEVGSAAMWAGGTYAVCRAGGEPELMDCAFLYAKA